MEQRTLYFILVVTLIWTAFVIVSERDIFFSKDTQALQKLTTLVTPETVVQTPENTPNVAQDSTPLGSSVQTIPKPEETPTQETQSQQTPKTTQDGYLAIIEHNSDTDESYKPTISPCVSPMGYTIGTLDPRFGISKETLQKEVDSAVQAWNNTAGKTLFVRSEKGPLTITLTYDERQATTVSIGYLRMEIENTKQNADSIKQLYEEEKVAYLRDSDQFNKDTESYTLRHDAYNKKVNDYNAKGGATKSEYDIMMTELEQLKTEIKSLEERRIALLDTMNRINEYVARYNDLVAYANSLIRKSNTLSDKKITEGRFIPSSNTIEIFQYADLIKFKRVLLHELGHAIGINHTENIQSIMFSFNSGTSTTFSVEDIAALRAVCN
ncbi:MAG: hypothetical protein RLZZ308_311 [Candidatus Parcubacteria bacterium]|jgi:hypothetical protein